jgi:hypothetical protein
LNIIIHVNTQSGRKVWARALRALSVSMSSQA